MSKRLLFLPALALLSGCPRPVRAAVDCSDEYIAARGVPECAAYLEKAQELVRAGEEKERQASAAARAAAVLETPAGFDGAGARPALSVEVPAAPAPSLDAPGGAGKASAGVPAPRTSEEKRRFWTAQGLNAAALGADLVTTAQVLRAGGSESNPLLALFGAKNLAGVLLSGLVLHLLQFWFVWSMFKKLRGMEGEARRRQLRVVLLATLLAAGFHVLAALHNGALLR